MNDFISKQEEKFFRNAPAMPKRLLLSWFDRTIHARLLLNRLHADIDSIHEMDKRLVRTFGRSEL